MMADNQTVGTGVFDEYPTYEEWIAHFDLDKPARHAEIDGISFRPSARVD